MAASLRQCLCWSLPKYQQRFIVSIGLRIEHFSTVGNVRREASAFIYPLIESSFVECTRNSSTFLSRTTADQLWKGVTSVSAAGKKKGRGKRMSQKRIVDLNRGQVIGFGKKNMQWPGLNAPILRGKEVISQRELPPDESREKRIIEMRDRMNAFKIHRIHPLERGWCGTRLPGRSLGPPDPVEEEQFEGFDSRVLQFRPVFRMTGMKGRVRKLSAFVVVGNKNGLAGFSKSLSSNGNTAAHNAKNRAAKVLRHIERYNDHTVLHDFHAYFGAQSVFVKKKPQGFGLVCHRVIRAVCEMVGIKDLYAKVEGNPKNTQNVTKAFFIGLMRQKSFKQLAEEKGLYIIEMRQERDSYPEIVGSPTRCRTEEEIPVDENLDFKLHVHNEKVEEFRKPYEPHFKNHRGHLKRVRDSEFLRNSRDVKVQLLARYGGLESFLTIREKEKQEQEVVKSVTAVAS